MQVHDTVHLTREAIQDLREELDYLRLTRRREVADMLRQSRDTDWAQISDAPYDPARDEQAFVEGRIAELEALLGHAREVDTTAGARSGRVALGSTVTVEDMRGRTLTYRVVDRAESNPAQGKVSDESPVGRALMGAAPGDTVAVKAPAGVQRLTVRAIS